MGKRIPPEALEYLKALGQTYGKLGGKKSAENLTPEQRSARAKKASLAAAKVRTAKRLEAESKRAKQTPARKKSK